MSSENYLKNSKQHEQLDGFRWPRRDICSQEDVHVGCAGLNKLCVVYMSARRNRINRGVL